LLGATGEAVTGPGQASHSRRDLQPGAQDLIIRGSPGLSGRLERCLPVGDYRDKAYRVNAIAKPVTCPGPWFEIIKAA